MITFGRLPVEILSLIVEHVECRKDVHTCTLVNKHFYSAANLVLWKTIDVTNDTSLLRVTMGIFLSQHQLGRHIRQLDLHVRLTNTTFLLLIRHFDLLDELNIHDAQLITDASFQHLPQHCPKLTSLLLNNASITCHSIQRLGQSCHQLRKLNLYCCMRLSPDSLSFLIDCCPLRELSITGNDPSGMFGKHWMTVDRTTMDMTQFDSLTHLTIAYWSTPFFISILTTINLNGNVPWPYLTYLDLKEGVGIGDHHIIPFIKLHPRLKHITLSYSNISDMTLNSISAFLLGVTHVDVAFTSDITARGLRRLVQNCPLLKYVNFEGGPILVRDFPEAIDQPGGSGGGGGVEGGYDDHLDELQQLAIDRIRHPSDVGDHGSN